MKQMRSTRPLKSARRCPLPCKVARACRSAAMVVLSHSRSCGGSQVACSGRSVRYHSAITPRITAGNPSTRKSHCQPRRPSAPSSASSASDTGAPTITATGAAVMKSAPVLARSAAGTQ